MLAIIIVNYRNEEQTIRFINKELVKITTDKKIVIVNNAATLNSNQKFINNFKCQLITEISNTVNKKDNIYLISSSKNLGFAQGNNLGVKFIQEHFDTKFILFTNNDIHFIDNNVVETLIEKLETLPDVGIIGPKIIGLSGELQSPEPYIPFLKRYVWIYLSTPFLSRKKKKEIFKLDYSQKAKEGYHYKIMGSFFIVRTADFIKCGMMDPNTFLYAEEVILTERMKKIHKKVYYYPKVSVLHEHGTTTKKNLGAKGINMNLLKSETYYYKKYMNIPSWEIYIGTLIYRTILFIKNKIR